MEHEDWCIDSEPNRADDDPGEAPRHGSGVLACTGPDADVAGVGVWLVREGRGPVRCVVAGHRLDRGAVQKLIAELGERAGAMPA